MQQSLSETKNVARLLGGGSRRLSDTLFRGFTLLLVLAVVSVIVVVIWVLYYITITFPIPTAMRGYRK